MKKLIIPLLFVLAFFAQFSSAHAQGSPVNLWCPLSSGGWTVCNSGNPLAVSASVSASITGFRPTGYGTPITATTGGATGSLPTGSEVVAFNVGANPAYCSLGGSVSSNANYIAASGGWFAFAISGDTQLTCEGIGGTTTINMAGGSGLPTGTGGGGGGSGSNASVGSTGSAVPSSATYIGITSGGNLTGWNGAVTNAGTFAVQATLQASATTAIGKVDPNTIANWALGAAGSAAPTNTVQTGGSDGTDLRAWLMSTTGQGHIICDSGCSGSGGTSSSFSSAFPSTGTAVGQSNGTNMVPFLADSNGYTEVNVKTATGLAQGSTTSGQTGSMVMGASTTNPPSYTTADTNPISTDLNGGIRTSPSCVGNAIPINQTASTDVHTFTGYGYICSIVLFTGTQQSISISEGTGTTCGTGTAYLIGGSGGTAVMAQYGGMAIASGTPWLKLKNSADHLCVLQSSSGNVSGTITFADMTN